MILAALRQAPILADLPPDELATLAAAVRATTCAPGELLFHEGQRDDHLCVLAQGQVEIVKALGTADERRLAICQPGALLGEMGLFSRDGAHTASVRALVPVQVLRISHAAFDDLLQRQPRLAYGMIRLLSQRLDEGEHITIRDLREKNRQLTQAYGELEAAQAQLVEAQRLERELEIAREIQRSMLPHTLPSVPGYDLGALMEPARLVGGDFYDALRLDDRRVALAVGDVCGKGVPAALFMAQSYSLLHAEASRGRSPGKTLREVNRHLQAVSSAGLYVTLLYAVLDRASGHLDYARAGHPPMLVMSSKGDLVDLPCHPGQMLGLFDEPLLDEGSLELAPGTVALIYSDGLSENLDAQGEEFGPTQIAQELAALPEASAQSLCAALWAAAQSRSSQAGVQDDLTVLALRRSKA